MLTSLPPTVYNLSTLFLKADFSYLKTFFDELNFIIDISKKLKNDR